MVEMVSVGREVQRFTMQARTRPQPVNQHAEAKLKSLIVVVKLCKYRGVAAVRWVGKRLEIAPAESNCDVPGHEVVNGRIPVGCVSGAQPASPQPGDDQVCGAVGAGGVE